MCPYIPVIAIEIDVYNYRPEMLIKLSSRRCYFITRRKFTINVKMYHLAKNCITSHWKIIVVIIRIMFHGKKDTNLTLTTNIVFMPSVFFIARR